MRFTRVAAALAVVGVITSGCAGNPFFDRIEAAAATVQTLGSATVDPKAIVVAANVAQSLQATARNYLRLPICSAASGAICRNPAATVPVINAVRSMRAARNAAQTFVKNHPGQLGPAGLYDALNSSIDALKSIFATYQIGGAS